MEEGGGSLDSLLFTKVGLITLIYFRVDRRRYPKDLISKFVGEKKYKKKLMDIPIKNSDIYIYTYISYIFRVPYSTLLLTFHHNWPLYNARNIIPGEDSGRLESNQALRSIRS